MKSRKLGVGRAGSRGRGLFVNGEQGRKVAQGGQAGTGIWDEIHHQWYSRSSGSNKRLMDTLRVRSTVHPIITARGLGDGVSKNRR